MKSHPLRIGLIGYGHIGHEVARLLAKYASGDLTFVGALVRHTEPSRHGEAVLLVTTLTALLAEHPQVIVEVAGHAGLREYGATVLRAGIDLLILSTGALAEPAVMQNLLDAAQQGQAHIKIVSGAIGALDIIAASAVDDGLTKVVHTMRKPPQTFLENQNASPLSKGSEIFRGNARQAVLQFPTFLNIAAAVALAGIGFDQTEVLVLADAAVRQSIHEVFAEGSCGQFSFKIDYAPSRVATLVAQSIFHTLMRKQGWFCLG